MVKRTLTLLLAGVLALLPATPALAAGGELPTASYPVIVRDGTDYVPLRDIAEDMGFTVEWDQPTQTATLSNGIYSVEVEPLTGAAVRSYAEETEPVPVLLEGWTTYVDKDFFQSLGTIVTVEDGSATAEADPTAATRDLIRGNEYGVKESYDFERYEVMLPMEDGVKLRTVIYKPVGDGPWPTAFTRGPYPGTEKTDSILGEEYAKRGMAFVFQYCRGKGGSEGTYVANMDERADGITSLYWLNDQDWVESIGVHGHSYLALTTWLVSDSLPEKVGALHIQCYGVMRNLTISRSGLPAPECIIAWTLNNCTDQYTYEKFIESAQYLPAVRADDDLWGGEVEGYDDWISHPDFTDPYWDTGVWGDLKQVADKIDVPVTLFSGYYDTNLEGVTAAWDMLKPETRAQSHMVLGCWTHGLGYAASWKGGENYDYNAKADTFNWFYSILVNGEVPATGVDAYVTGKDQWVHTDSFPLDSDGTLTYYLTQEDVACEGEASLLAAEKPEEQTTVSYVYDPKDPKLSEGGTQFLVSDLSGSRVLSPAGYRDDVISFVSEPLAEDVTLAGELVADLFVSTDVEDTAFTYTISEVDETGTAHNIRNGLLTLSYRHDRLGPAVYDYEPGQIVELEVKSLPIVWTIPAGHSIRIDISSSNFPEFASHTNTVGNWALQTESKVANQTIYIGGEYASSVTLPILTAED